MPTREVYAERKALRLCVACGIRDADPLVTLCGGCREGERQRKIAQRLACPPRAQETYARIHAVHPDIRGANVLACCGRFHPITRVPFRAPCCKRLFFTEDRI